jgi:type IV secretory pathway TrbD component
MRTNRVYKVMNRPLKILGAERRLFFGALLTGAGIFNLVHSLAGGVLLFVVGLIAAQRYIGSATAHTPAAATAVSTGSRWVFVTAIHNHEQSVYE